MNKTLPFQTLQEAAFATIAYCDIFAFAPTLQEVRKWLLRYGNSTDRPSLLDLENALSANSSLACTQGFWHLRGRDDLVQARKEKYNYTEAKWQHARPYIRLLAMLPFVQGIWFGNSMGWNNARRTSDIDLVVVTSPGHIWTARFFTTAVMKMLRQRPGQQAQSKALCLSMYINAEHLTLEAYRESANDIYMAFWCAQLYPVVDTGAYAEFSARNPWLNDVFQDIQWNAAVPTRSLFLTTTQRALQHIAESFMRFAWVERWMERLQQRILPAQLKEMANVDTRVMLNTDILKFHTNDRRVDIQHEWQQRLEQYAEQTHSA